VDQKLMAITEQVQVKLDQKLKKALRSSKKFSNT